MEVSKKKTARGRSAKRKTPAGKQPGDDDLALRLIGSTRLVFPAHRVQPDEGSVVRSVALDTIRAELDQLPTPVLVALIPTVSKVRGEFGDFPAPPPQVEDSA